MAYGRHGINGRWGKRGGDGNEEPSGAETAARPREERKKPGGWGAASR